MFKNYLVSLKEERENKQIESSVNEMKSLIQKMDIMLDSVGKNVLLKEDPKEYDEVINQQEILGLCNSVVKIFHIGIDKDKHQESDNHNEIIITKFFERLKKVKNMSLFEDIIFRNIDRWKEMVDILGDNQEFGVYYDSSKNTDILKDIYDKIYLLFNDESEKKVKEVMMKGVYFNRFII